jgi:hypothetical protein
VAKKMEQIFIARLSRRIQGAYDSRLHAPIGGLTNGTYKIVSVFAASMD